MSVSARDDLDARMRDLERRLEESERRLEETQALTRVGSWELPLPSGAATWSKEMLRLYERDMDGRPPRMAELLAAVHPDDRRGVVEALERMRVRPGIFDHSYRIIDSEGEVHYLRGHGLTVADEAGRPIRAYGTTQDISETTRSQFRLEETQALARVGSWEWEITEDEKWQPIWSREMYRIFGRDPDGPPPTRDELLGYVHSEDRPAFGQLVARVRSAPGPFEHSYRIVREDGEIRHMQARGYVEADAAGRPTRTHGTTQDITELRESQAQLERARRLEAVGHLAGGVAHDFNNLLSVILNYAESLIDVGADPETMKGLREIERAALSGADLTRQLLLFNRRDSNETRPIDLAAVVAETEEMLRRTIGDHIELTVDAPRELSPAMLGDGEAQQILVNLVVNARDALPRGGNVAIAVRESEATGSGVDSGVVRLQSGSPCLILTVSDDGVGMSEEVAAQAFDPFFTTKPRGKGTGLGLATVYGIAGKAGGHVEIESELGRGTAVSVYLPVSSEPTGVEVERGSRRTNPASGEGRTVLVVDNEEAVRTVVCHMLRRRGYQTCAVASGAEAEALLAEAGTAVDLLLTDMSMPGMSGKELASRVNSGHAAFPTVYMTGYAGDEASPLGSWDEDATILQKPFTADQLLGAIDDALLAR